jgi:hypothetical protein
MDEKLVGNGDEAIRNGCSEIPPETEDFLLAKRNGAEAAKEIPRPSGMVPGLRSGFHSGWRLTGGLARAGSGA